MNIISQLWQSIEKIFSNKPVGSSVELCSEATFGSEILSIPDDVIKNWSADNKASAAEILLKEKDKNKDALAKLFKNLKKEDYYSGQDEIKIRKLNAAITNDKEIMDAKLKWPDISLDEKKKTLQKVADHHADAFGIPKSSMEYYPPPQENLDAYGYFGSNSVSINTTMMDDPNESFDTVAHENTHRYQSYQVEKLENGGLKHGTTEYNQARLFKANDDEHGGIYFGPDDSYDAYKNQPLESQAWLAGAAAVQPSSPIPRPNAAIAKP